MEKESKKEFNKLLPVLIDEYVFVYSELKARMPKADPEALSRLTIAIVKHSRLWKS